MATVPIRAAARCRPLSPDEEKYKSESVTVQLEGQQTVLRTADGQSKAYELPTFYSTQATNEQVYNELIAPLTLKAFEGYHASVVTYGTSGSGKGYTLIGDPSGREPGIIERAANDLFARIAADKSHRFLVTFSMVEIRKEQIVDVLNPVLDGSVTLSVEDHRAFGSYVPGLCELVVHGADEIREYLQQGIKVVNALMRRAASTLQAALAQGQGGQMSGATAKPHYIVEIKVEAQQNGNLISPIRYSTFRFVHTTGCGGMAKDTDPSLRALGTVIELLAAGKEPYTVPYNSSVLSRLLENSLGGNCTTVLLALIDSAGADDSALDAEHTLDIAARAQMISNRPVLNINTLAVTIQDLREEIRRARGKLNLANPGNYLNELDPKLLENLKHLMAELDKVKQETWESKVAASQKFAEQRKETLNRAGLYIVLEEDVVLDNELVRKVEKERRNLVLQTYVVEQKDAKFAKERDALTHALKLYAEGKAPGREDELRKKQEDVKELEKTSEHQREKLDKMKANFSKYIAQVVEMEERQRKTFLLAHESQRLHIAKEKEDWKEVESLKGGDPKLREKLKEVQKEHKDALEAIGRKYDAVTTGAVPADGAKQLEIDYVTSQRQLREKLEEMRWERDQLLGRLIERDFRHEAQCNRMQKQMFMVFREYRRHFEEQKAKMEARYRKIVEDSVQDTLRLHRKNLELEAQLEKYQGDRANARIFISNEQYRANLPGASQS